LRLFLILGEEQHPHSQRLGGSQEELALAEQIFARYGCLHAHTIAALAVSGNSAAMGKAAESGQGKSQNFVFGTPVKGRNESYAAGFVLVASVEEVVSTRRKAATTHSPLYMESAVQMKGEIRKPQKLVN
jgi:hypothetical protein